MDGDGAINATFLAEREKDMGRIGLYHEWLTEEKLTLVEGWARSGLTEKQIAENIGIAERTLNEWKVKYPQFLQTLKKGKEVTDYIVENALYKKAIGYTKVETKTEIIDGKEKVTRYEKHVPPDVTAQIFWLKNRRPDKWSDKPKGSEEYEDDGLIEALTNAIRCVDDNDMLGS